VKLNRAQRHAPPICLVAVFRCDIAASLLWKKGQTAGQAHNNTAEPVFSGCRFAR
jgi:hypothetical protein